jgi:hypothetical protein
MCEEKVGATPAALHLATLLHVHTDLLKRVLIDRLGGEGGGGAGSGVEGATRSGGRGAVGKWVREASRETKLSELPSLVWVRRHGGAIAVKLAVLCALVPTAVQRTVLNGHLQRHSRTELIQLFCLVHFL